MQTEEIIAHANELIHLANALGEKDYAKFRGIYARVSDFLISFAGKNSPFLSQIESRSLPSDRSKAGQYVAEILKAYIVVV